MTETVSANWSLARRIWVLCFLSYAFFVPSPENYNSVTRIALTLAVIDRQDLTIDPFVPETRDRASVDGHFYSDKAPGLSFLALPAAFVVDKLLNPEGRQEVWFPDPEHWHGTFAILVYLASLSTVGLLTATAAAAIFNFCVTRGTSPTAAALAALTYGLGTPTFGWATVFFGHAASGALLLIGFGLLTASLTPNVRRRSVIVGQALLAGLAMGLAFVVEFPAAPAVAIIATLCGVEALCRGMMPRQVFGRMTGAGLGVAIMLALLGAYNVAAFGSPFVLGYASVPEFPGMETGFYGISWPRLDVIAKLLFGTYRGLLPLTPVLILAPVAFVWCLRETRWRSAAVASMLIFCWYLTMNAGYFYWNGGASTGPRHIVPSLPFLALLLAPLWDQARKTLRAGFLILLLFSIGMSLICASEGMFAPQWLDNPMLQLFLPRLLSGYLPNVIQFGPLLPGVFSLLPLLLFWFLIGREIVVLALLDIRSGAWELWLGRHT